MRKTLLGLCFVVVGVVVADRLAAEPPPDPGVWTATYYVDRFDRAHLGGLRIPSSLQPRFARYEGERVRADVTRVRQISMPGIPYAQEVGEIVEVPTTPRLFLSVHRHERDRFGVRIRNLHSAAVTIEVRRVRLHGMFRRWHKQHIEAVAFQRDLGHTWMRLTGVRLMPGEFLTIPFRWRRRLPDGEHEIRANYAQSTARLAFELMPPEDPSTLGATLIAEVPAEERHDLGIRLLRVHMSPRRGRRPVLLRHTHARGFVYASTLRAWTERGEEVNIGYESMLAELSVRSSDIQRDTTWEPSPMPRNGVHLSFRVHLVAGKAWSTVDRWTLDVLKDEGLETVAIRKE